MGFKGLLFLAYVYHLVYKVIYKLRNRRRGDLQECKRCHGTGKVNTAADDEVTGKRLRQLREKRDVSLRKVAEKIGKSPTYLSRLENGRERWNADLEKAYRAAIGEG